MATPIILTTNIELEAQTVLNLGPGGGYRKSPIINNTTGTIATYPAKQTRADKTGSTINTTCGFSITTYPYQNPSANTTAGTNPTTTTNPTETPNFKDITLTTTLILYFNAIGQTVYTIGQPYGESTNIYDQILVGNWLGYLTAEAKGIKNIIPYSGVLLGTNNTTDLRLTNASIYFTTARVKPTLAKSTGNGIIVVWYHDGTPIDQTKYTTLTNQGYKIPLIGNTGYSQTTINLNLTLNGPQ
jgi:hypothetical protein